MQIAVSISEPEAQTSVAKSGLSPAYVTAWGIIGLVSAVYLGIVAAAPEMIGLPAHDRALESIARTGPEPVPADESEPLSAARMEIAKLKTELKLREEQADRQRAAIPAAVPDVELAAVADTAAPASAPATTQPEIAQPDAEAVRERQAERQIADAVILNAPQTATALETGSIAPAAASLDVPAPERAPDRTKVAERLPSAVSSGPAEQRPPPQKTARVPAQGPVVAFGAPVVKPAVAADTRQPPAALGISLARAQSIEALRNTWSLLRARNGEAFLGLVPRYQMTGSDPRLGPTYSLIAGPLKSAEDVARVCSAAIESGLTCATMPYGGNAL
ncbi:MAG: hypothetical protein NW217_06775 [Hyphomicrobiaceae bacterium]|nr:hypothetical protein [Hyphomicrobiaceae bacterium]